MTLWLPWHAVFLSIITHNYNHIYIYISPYIICAHSFLDAKPLELGFLLSIYSTQCIFFKKKTSKGLDKFRFRANELVKKIKKKLFLVTDVYYHKT